MMHRKLKAEQKQRKNMKREFYSKWKDYIGVEYDQGDNLMFCFPCSKYEKEGRFVIGTSIRIEFIKQHEASKSHINSQRRFDIDCLNGKSSTVVCSYTGKVDDRASQSLNIEVGGLWPPVVGARDITVQRINENQKEKLCCVFNTANFVAKNELPYTLYLRVLELQEKMEWFFHQVIKQIWHVADLLSISTMITSSLISVV